MRVSGVREKGEELAVSGQLAEGSYSGPEAVLLCDESGQWVHSAIVEHAIEFPKDWPVLPRDGSTLVLSIAKPRSGFKLDRSQPVIGQGAVHRNHDRVDISASLNDPAFWAIWMPLHLDCDSLPEPSLAWGFTGDQVNSEYEKRFQAHWDAGIWPYVRCDLPQGRYAEIEFASGIEHQSRVWIGSADGPRVLLGYDSGHCSFPALRIQELLDLAARLDGQAAAVPLLFLAGTWLDEDASLPDEAVRHWLRHSPGFRPDCEDAVVTELANNVVPDLAWELNQDLGWINNGPYSQRNQKSTMSILTREDFHFIRDFFRF